MTTGGAARGSCGLCACSVLDLPPPDYRSHYLFNDRLAPPDKNTLHRVLRAGDAPSGSCFVGLMPTERWSEAASRPGISRFTSTDRASGVRAVPAEFGRAV